MASSANASLVLDAQCQGRGNKERSRHRADLVERFVQAEGRSRVCGR